VMPGSTEIAATPEAALDYGIIGIDPGVGQITWIATAGFGERPKLYPAADGSPLVALLDPDLVTLRFIDTEQGMLLSELLILNAPIALPPLIDGRVGDAYLSLKDGSLIAMRLDRGYALRTE